MSLRNKLTGSSQQRYHTGEFDALEDVSDPRTRTDETKTTIKDWMSENQILTILILLGGLVGLAILSNWLITVVPSFVGNIWVQRFVAASILAIGMYTIGVKRALGTYEQFDWLILAKSDSVKFYLGYHKDPDESNYPLFIPVKGMSMMGHRTEAFQIKDLSRELVRMASTDLDIEDPVVIRLHPEFAVSTETDYGTVVAQLSEGLDLDEYGRESNIEATLPDVADDDAISGLKEKLKRQTQELNNVKSQKEMFRRQRNNAREEARKNRKELIDEFAKQYGRFAGTETGMGHAPMSGGFEEPFDDQMEPEEEIPMEDIDSELEGDDEV